MKLDLGAISAIENEAGVSGGSNINLINNNDDHLIPAIEDASIIRTPECYVGDQKDTSEVLTSEGRLGYKQQVRNQRVKIDPEQNYDPGQVAAALNLSYDTALRRMQKMKGVVDSSTRGAFRVLMVLATMLSAGLAKSMRFGQNRSIAEAWQWQRIRLQQDLT